MLTAWMLSITHNVCQRLANEQLFHYWALWPVVESHSLKCSPFIIMSSLLDSHDKWEASREDMNSKMHFCLSGGANCSSNPYLLWCLENLMPLLDTQCCMIVGCQLDGTIYVQVVLMFKAKLSEINHNTVLVLNAKCFIKHEACSE